MSDFLLIVAASLPALIGIVVLVWGVLFLMGVAVGRVIAEDDRPYDWERDYRDEVA